MIDAGIFESSWKEKTMMRSVVQAALLAMLLTEPTWAAPYTDEKAIINEKGQRLVCRTTKKDYSRFMKRECITKEDWDKMSDNAQRMWHEWVFMKGGQCAGGMPGC